MSSSFKLLVIVSMVLFAGVAWFLVPRNAPSPVAPHTDPKRPPSSPEGLGNETPSLVSSSTETPPDTALDVDQERGLQPLLDYVARVRSLGQLDMQTSAEADAKCVRLLGKLEESTEDDLLLVLLMSKALDNLDGLPFDSQLGAYASILVHTRLQENEDLLPHVERLFVHGESATSQRSMFHTLLTYAGTTDEDYGDELEGLMEDAYYENEDIRVRGSIVANLPFNGLYYDRIDEFVESYWNKDDLESALSFASLVIATEKGQKAQRPEESEPLRDSGAHYLKMVEQYAQDRQATKEQLTTILNFVWKQEPDYLGTFVERIDLTGYDKEFTDAVRTWAKQ